MLNIVRFPQKTHILSFLKLEEAVMRNEKSRDMWLFLLEGSPECIVMGAGSRARPHEWIDIPKVKEDKMTVIKRFTGGGTVLINNDSLFSSLIAPIELLKHDGFDHFPKSIMKWSEILFKEVMFDFFSTIRMSATSATSCQRQSFMSIPNKFSLRENDFVFDDKKFGGNAQYISGGKVGRFVHHTSFLWDFDPDKMSKYLVLPERRPNYRQSRTHSSFLCGLKEVVFGPKTEKSKFSGQEIPENENSRMKTLFLDSIETTTSDFVMSKKWNKVFPNGVKLVDYNDVCARFNVENFQSSSLILDFETKNKE